MALEGEAFARPVLKRLGLRRKAALGGRDFHAACIAQGAIACASSSMQGLCMEPRP